MKGAWRRLGPLLGICLLAAQPMGAEPFGVVDVAALVPASGLAGPVSRADGTVLYRDDAGEAVLCDPTRGRNLAELTIELQMAQTVLLACEGFVNAARRAQVAHLRAFVLPRYAVRAGVNESRLRAVFATRARDEVALVTRCGVTANEILADVVDPWFETRIREAMIPDRTPARACPTEW